MKLVEILARELDEWNPYFGGFAVQDPDNDNTIWGARSSPVFSDPSWVGGGHFSLLIDKCDCLADDHATAIVTRAQWQAAVDALGIPKFLSDDAEWNGEGLPPVGVAIDFAEVKNSVWRGGCVRYLSDYTCIISAYDQDGEFIAHPMTMMFRAARTPEQIAEEEREKGISEIAEWIGLMPNRTPRECAVTVWNAGYRKQEQE